MCAYYEPPTEIDPIFNSLAFRGANDAALTIAEGDERYLARQNVATSVATATSFSAEVAATSWTSLNSGATNFHLDNLAGNNAPLIIRNQRTDQNTFYRQLGTTNSHIFQTNGAATTNLTLSNTLNTSSLPLLATFAAAGSATRIIEAVDSTSGNRFAIIPSTTNGNLGPMCLIGDTQIVSIAGSAGASILSISPWTNNTVGIRMTGTQLNIGAGGTTSVAPNSAILFNSSANNATVTGTMTFSSDIILRTTQPTNTSGYLGYTVKQNATNTAAITTATAYNLNATGLSLTPGVYIFNIMLNNSKLAAGSGDINVIQVGISTGSGSFVGGATTLVMGQQTYAVSGAAQDVIGNGSFTFSVPTTATYYLLQQAAHTIGAVNLIGTTNSYWQYTRVA